MGGEDIGNPCPFTKKKEGNTCIRGFYGQKNDEPICVASHEHRGNKYLTLISYNREGKITCIEKYIYIAENDARSYYKKRRNEKTDELVFVAESQYYLEKQKKREEEIKKEPCPQTKEEEKKEEEPYCVIKHLNRVLMDGVETKEDKFIRMGYIMSGTKLPREHPKDHCPWCEIEEKEKKEKTLSDFTFQDLYNEIEKAKTYVWDGKRDSKERDFPLITAVHNVTSHFSYVVEENRLAHKQKLAVDKDLEFFKKTICNGKEEEEKKA
jgi:hypothetical protein